MILLRRCDVVQLCSDKTRILMEGVAKCDITARDAASASASVKPLDVFNETSEHFSAMFSVT